MLIFILLIGIMKLDLRLNTSTNKGLRPHRRAATGAKK